MEKKIIEGKFKKSWLPLIICALCILIFFFSAVAEMNETNRLNNLVIDDYDYDYEANIIDGFCNVICFWDSCNLEWNIFALICLLASVVSVIIHFMVKNCEISVSTTRVVGKASFGKRVDLPLNQISAIGLGMFKSIAIATSSGKINFWLLTNRNEVHEALSQQLAAFQVQASSNDAAKVATTSSADELKKFKELLDAGVITQEEFDSKKKQLLGL